MSFKQLSNLFYNIIIMKKKILNYMYIYDPIIRNKQLNYNTVVSEQLINQSNTQYGGAKYNISYNDDIYTFEKINYDNIYVLYSFDKLNNDCITITVDEENNVANINNINGDIKNCVTSNNKVGTTLLLISIKFLKKYSKKLNINLIMLTDNSYKKCGNKNISLMLLSTLTTGDTWYGKYGFVPIYYDGNKYLPNKQNIDIYNKNKELMENIKVNDVNKILLNYFEKLDNFSKEQYTIIKKIIKDKPEMLLKDFLKKFLKNYDKMCIYFEQFYTDLYYKIGLQNTTNLFGLFLV
jgi:hypothetical protein